MHIITLLQLFLFYIPSMARETLPVLAQERSKGFMFLIRVHRRHYSGDLLAISPTTSFEDDCPA